MYSFPFITEELLKEALNTITLFYGLYTRM